MHAAASSMNAWRARLLRATQRGFFCIGFFVKRERKKQMAYRLSLLRVQIILQPGRTALLVFSKSPAKLAAMNRLPSVLPAFFLLALASCSTFHDKKEDAPVKVAWVFDIQADPGGLPRGSVFLQVDAERVLVHPNVEMGYKLIDPADYVQHKIPPEALAACTSYGVGRGEELYVIREKKDLAIFGRMLDEEGASADYRLRTTIPVK
jgi:hypothetical protein